ncbi:MAG: hypothetical protein ACOYK6_04640 [Chthoniobacterales bacterium]
MKKILQSFSVVFLFGLLFSSTFLLGEVAQDSPTTSTDELPKAVDLDDSKLLEIGIKIWQNQNSVWNKPDDRSGITKKMKKGITEWEESGDEPGENSHALIGIGQFIWYPDANPKLFQEDWPRVAQLLEDSGVHIPKWAKGACPWPNREAFEDDFDGPHLKWLRKHLAKKDAIIEQTRCIAQRLDEALAKIQADIDAEVQASTGTDSEGLPTSPETKEKITRRFNQIVATQEPCGRYALMDYIHFCGEGILKTERNKEQPNGWGLRQALDHMKEETIVSQGPIQALVDSANDLYAYGDEYNHQRRYNTYLSFSLDQDAEGEGN